MTDLYIQGAMSHNMPYIFVLVELMIYGVGVQHWRSTAACAAALELPNINYELGTEQTLKLKP